MGWCNHLCHMLQLLSAPAGEGGALLGPTFNPAPLECLLTYVPVYLCATRTHAHTRIHTHIHTRNTHTRTHIHPCCVGAWPLLLASPSRYQNCYNGRALTEEEITGLLIAVLFAGQHTSSITTAWTGIFMTANKVWVWGVGVGGEGGGGIAWGEGQAKGARKGGSRA